VASSGCTSAASNTISVTVNPSPATPTIAPGGATTFCQGGSVTLSSSSSTGNQWLLNGAPISGATSATYSATSSGNYTVQVTASGCPSLPSAATTVTVNANPGTPTFTVPPFVNANSTGNSASTSAATTWAWTITNGTITSATNIQSITFTAGPNGQVILGVTVTNGTTCSAISSMSVPINRL